MLNLTPISMAPNKETVKYGFWNLCHQSNWKIRPEKKEQIWSFRVSVDLNLVLLILAECFNFSQFHFGSLFVFSTSSSGATSLTKGLFMREICPNVCPWTKNNGIFVWPSRRGCFRVQTALLVPSNKENLNRSNIFDDLMQTSLRLSLRIYCWKIYCDSC